MLPRINRLMHMKDWEILFKEGKFFGGDLVTIKIWKIDPEKYTRRSYGTGDLKIGFAVGLKISKSAVKRNRVKRQMREVVRLLLKQGFLAGGYMVGVIAKKDILDKEYAEIEKDVVKTFKKAKLLI